VLVPLAALVAGDGLAATLAGEALVSLGADASGGVDASLAVVGPGDALGVAGIVDDDALGTVAIVDGEAFVDEVDATLAGEK
jgi:glucokinase